ncbi:MAG TPA: hypothetical protein VK862_11205 [Afifellaceae bacterium]|nr:hypothetical protein [Afifellaceae bacterium]
MNISVSARLPGLHCLRPMRSAAIAVSLVPALILPAFAAGAIIDRQSCMSELASAEEAIVRANIDSAAFRALSDQLAGMKALCEGDDYTGAQTKLRDVMNALGDAGSKS